MHTYVFVLTNITSTLSSHPFLPPTLFSKVHHHFACFFRRPLRRSRSSDPLLSPVCFLLSLSSLCSLISAAGRALRKLRSRISSFRSVASGGEFRRVRTVSVFPMVVAFSLVLGVPAFLFCLWRVDAGWVFFTAVLSVFGRGVCPWLALARSFVAGFLFLFSLGLSVVLPVTARESQSGAIVGLMLWPSGYSRLS
ncbi:hypothetical protein IGI04_027574 [Brassica rapa subsp. trilocularis]|uniref:Transmembrane protein n=1 Tax=Brassica rapa subsp. trilocularis TaxID=1813537 RepID=A0ABQ7KZE9_BRACM|nr:hypothetical protein IGI04_027574 [Brassica rapa subsp. trilocularis]